MLLAIDIGNSNIKFGVFDGELLTSKLSIPTIKELSVDALAKVVANRVPGPISSVIISSVVPEIDGAMYEFINREFGVNPIIVKNDFDFGLTINHTPLADAGSDRLVNAFSAAEKYAVPCIVCSFGTALTIDVVNADRTLLGGVIAPGMKSMAAALKTTTSRLPEVRINLPDAVIQTTTIAAIQSGIMFGYFGLAENLISRVKNEIADNAKVIATGGFAALIANNTTGIDIVDENLPLEGLRRLYARIT